MMKNRSNLFVGAVMAALSLVSAHSDAATYYWDGPAVVVDGASAGGSASWSVGAAGWEDGVGAVNWADGHLAAFGGAGGTVTVAGPIAASGIRVAGSAAPYAFTSTERRVMSVGAEGINLGATTANVSLNNLTVAAGQSQTWAVADGHSLSLSAVNALNGQLTGSNATTITVTGGGLVDLLTNATGAGGYAGHWLVQGGSTLRTLRNNAAALGTGTVTLDGGRLAFGGVAGSGAQGNWTFNNSIILNPGGLNTIEQQNPSGADRWMKLDGVISGAGHVSFRNPLFGSGIGTNDELGFILAANHTFTGSLTIEPSAFVRIGGAAVGSTTNPAGNNGSIPATSAIINNGLLRLTRNDSWALANPISGSGAIKIGGTIGTTNQQVVTLSGISSFNGLTTVVNGTLNLTGSLASPIAVNSGAKLMGSGSTSGRVTFAEGAILQLAGGATTTSLSSQGVTFDGPTSVSFAQTPLVGTVYDVLSYGAGEITNDWQLAAKYRGTLVDDEVNRKFTFTAGGVGTRTWNSVSNSGFWSVGIDENWIEGDRLFYDGDEVIFGDTPDDAIVTLDTKVSPASVIVNNSAHTYTFVGDRARYEITGATGLIKNNAGTLALDSAHSFTGGTIVNGGVLDLIGTSQGEGAIRGTVTVNNGGTLRLSTADAMGSNINSTRLSVINLAGGTLDVNTSLGQTLGSAAINLTAGSITGIAESRMDLAGGSSSIHSLASASTSTISLPTLGLRQDNSIFNTAEGAAEVDLQISSVISNGAQGNHRLHKTGAGTLVLSGVNLYDGGTEVLAGTLSVGAMSGIGTSYLAVKSGATFRYTGTTPETRSGVFWFDNGNANIDVSHAATTLTFWRTGGNHNQALIKLGPGTLRYGANGDNSGARAQVEAGVLESISSANNCFANVTVNAGGTFRLGTTDGTGAALTADHQIWNGGTLTLNEGGTFDQNGMNETVATLVLAGGAASGTGTLTVGTAINAQSGTVTSNLAGAAGLTKSTVGVVTLGGLNRYTGNTLVSEGTLALADNAQLRFVVGENGVNNKVSGTGTLSLAGDFSLDLTGAVVAPGNTWTLVDVSTLSVAFQNSFSLVGFSKAGGVHTMTDGAGRKWTFSETTGALSVETSTGGYTTWAASNAGGGTAAQDFDGDGVSNGIEYFLGATGSTFTPNPSVVGGKVTWVNGGNIPSSAYGTQFVLQTSPNLTVWTNVAAGDPNLSNTQAAVEYTIPTGANRVFVRLQVLPN
jgi:fibronectin-binding autotransporter adhesin